MLLHRSPRPIRPGAAALFLDRDGVLNRRVEGDYVRAPADLHVIDSTVEQMRPLAGSGVPTVIVSNQGGVGRGLMSTEDLVAVNARLLDVLEAAGVAVDAVYCCPHHPGAERPEWRACDCRKPLPGLFLQAAGDLQVDLAGSAMIGDRPSDREAALAAGLTPSRILVLDDALPASGSVSEFLAASFPTGD